MLSIKTCFGEVARWKHLLLLSAVFLTVVSVTSAQECVLDHLQDLKALIDDDDQFSTTREGALYISRTACPCQGMITDISVVFRTRDESRRLHKLQLAIYSVKDDNTFRRISEIVIIPSMSRLVIDLTSGVSITFINLEPGQQMEISEGQTVGVQVNGDSGNGHPWLIGGTNSSFKISSGSIRDEVVRGNMRDLAQFPGMSFFVKRSSTSENVDPVSPSSTQPPSTADTNATSVPRDSLSEDQHQPVVLYVLPVIVVVFVVLIALILGITIWTLRKKGKLSREIPNGSVASTVAVVGLPITEENRTTEEHEVVPQAKLRERSGSPLSVDIDYTPYDSCYMYTYMYADELERPGPDPLPYEVPLDRHGIRSSKRSVHFVHLDTHPMVTHHTGNVIYENLHPFQPPPGDVQQLRNTLAQRKCAEIPRNALKKGNLIGKGEFGAVYNGFWEAPTRMVQPVAMKMLRDNANKQDRVKFLQEAAIMGQFNHPHIVKLLGAITAAEPMMLVLELLQEGDLLQWLENHSSKNEVDVADMPKQLLYYSQDIADGMKYLSNKGFIHRDLAARNILLDKNLRCKIADFGLARDLYGSTYYASSAAKVPVRWSPPEVLSERRYSLRSDVWSFGMVMFEIWSLGKMPFAEIGNLRNVIKTVVKKKGYIQPPPPGCPRAIYKLMVQCWNFNDADRIPFNEVSILLSPLKEALLDVPREDLDLCRFPHKASRLGSPLATSTDLYQDLQSFYLTP